MNEEIKISVEDRIRGNLYRQGMYTGCLLGGLFSLGVGTIISLGVYSYITSNNNPEIHQPRPLTHTQPLLKSELPDKLNNEPPRLR
ncbi:hypothetical protein J4429_02430 [Candidatus Pacearchaeota archaeon]|nr:hypothetical protein [Candidatus Pacearchaeota archaeon]